MKERVPELNWPWATGTPGRAEEDTPQHGGGFSSSPRSGLQWGKVLELLIAHLTPTNHLTAHPPPSPPRHPCITFFHIFWSFLHITMARFWQNISKDVFLSYFINTIILAIKLASFKSSHSLCRREEVSWQDSANEWSKFGGGPSLVMSCRLRHGFYKFLLRRQKYHHVWDLSDCFSKDLFECTCLDVVLILLVMAVKGENEML